jgi:hypothetical protein
MGSIFGPRLSIFSNFKDLDMAVANKYAAMGITKEQVDAEKLVDLEKKMVDAENEYHAFVAKMCGGTYVPPTQHVAPVTPVFAASVEPVVIQPVISEVKTIDGVPLPPADSKTPQTLTTIPIILHGANSAKSVVTKTAAEIEIEQRIDAIREVSPETFDKCKEILVQIASRADMPRVMKYFERMKNAINIIIMSDIQTIDDNTVNRPEFVQLRKLYEKVIFDKQCKISKEDALVIAETCFTFICMIYGRETGKTLSDIEEVLHSKSQVYGPPKLLADIFNTCMVCIGVPVYQFIYDKVDLEEAKKQYEFITRLDSMENNPQ